MSLLAIWQHRDVRRPARNPLRQRYRAFPADRDELRDHRLVPGERPVILLVAVGVAHSHAIHARLRACEEQLPHVVGQNYHRRERLDDVPGRLDRRAQKCRSRSAPFPARRRGAALRTASDPRAQSATGRPTSSRRSDNPFPRSLRASCSPCVLHPGCFDSCRRHRFLKPE